MAPIPEGMGLEASERIDDFGWRRRQHKERRSQCNGTNLVTYTRPALIDPADARANTG